MQIARLAETFSIKFPVRHHSILGVGGSNYIRCKSHDRTNKTGTSTTAAKQRDDSSLGEERWPISRYSAHMPRSTTRCSCGGTSYRVAAPRCTARALRRSRVHKRARLSRESPSTDCELQTAIYSISLWRKLLTTLCKQFLFERELSLSLTVTKKNAIIFKIAFAKFGNKTFDYWTHSVIYIRKHCVI